MLHAQLVIHRLLLDGVPVAVRHATLAAVVRAEQEGMDWEVVAECVEEVDAELGRLHAAMTCITGASADGILEFSDLSGDALVVRFMDTTLVLRGDGPLTGLDLNLLKG